MLFRSAEMNGFEMVAFQKSETPMMSDKMILPVLNMIFRLTDKKNSIKSAEKSIRLKKEMKQYAVNEFERLNKWQAVIQKLTESQRPVYVWGIGREFLYLYASAGLKQCGLIGLIDSNPYKQNNCRMDGKKIFGGDILSKATPESILLITAIAHRDRIIKEVRGVLGFKGKIVDL